MKCARAVLAVAAILGSLSSRAVAQEKIDLKPSFVPGEYRQTVSTKGQQSRVVNGEPTRQSITQEIVQDIVIAPPDADGVKTMTWTFVGVRMTSQTGGMTASFDSARAEVGDKELRKMLGPSVGATAVIKLSADGKVIEAKGMDALWDRQARDKRDMIDTAAAMKKVFGDAQIKEMVEQTFSQLPGKPVAVGEEWKTATALDAPMLGKIAMTTVSKLVKVEQTTAGKRAVIEFAGRAVTDKPQTTTLPTGTATISNVKIDTAGRQTVQVDNPMLSEGTMKQTGSMDMSIGAAAAGQEVVVKVNFETDTTIKTAKAPAKEGTTEPAK